jgi:hypothetical protein
MSADQIFSIASGLALLSWLLLAALPRQRWVTQVVTGLVVPALFAIVYAGIVAPRFLSSDGGFGSLADVMKLFTDRWMVLAGWIHYLAFDLLTGTWEVRDAQARGMSHLLVLPCLFLTFMFGPTGWLLYIVLRTTSKRPAAA